MVIARPSPHEIRHGSKPPSRVGSTAASVAGSRPPSVCGSVASVRPQDPLNQLTGHKPGTKLGSKRGGTLEEIQAFTGFVPSGKVAEFDGPQQFFIGSGQQAEFDPPLLSLADLEENSQSRADWPAGAPKADTPSQTVTPPRAWVQVADWGNVLAGVFLMAAFLEGALINSVKMEFLLVSPGGPPNQKALDWLQFLFNIEGAFYAIAEFFMTGIMALTPAEFGGGSRGVMQFVILTVGGVFFGFSGLVFPGCITNVTYLFRNEECPHVAAHGPYVWNAVAHFGITCFMTGTAIGFLGVVKAPKDKLVSPFWGVTMFFLGAWTIGIFKFWLPVLCGGFNPHQNGHSMANFDLNAPVIAWTWTWWFAFLGAGFLTFGAVIFALMNGSFNIRCA